MTHGFDDNWHTLFFALHAITLTLTPEVLYLSKLLVTLSKKF